MRRSARDRRVLREARRRRIRRGFDLWRVLHAKQHAACTAKGAKGGRRKVILAGRRGGKTYGIAATMLFMACFHGWRNVYITLTRSNAQELVWDDLLKLNREFCLGGKIRLQKLRIEFPNGGVVALAGCNNNREIEKIRGKRWHRVYVDECQSIPDRVLIPLLGPILAPTLLDFGGELWLHGSRPAVPIGRWWEVTEGPRAKNYEQHRYDIRDNTMLPARRAGKDIDEILRQFREDEGWSEADITYRREVLNEDIPDLEALLFSFDVTRNVTTDIPTCDYFVLGIDQGADDSDAIAVLGWRDNDPNLYLVEEFVRAKDPANPVADVTDLAVEIQARIERYAPLRMVIDQGGGGKKSAEEIRRRWKIPVQPAEKSDKPGFIKLLNVDLRKSKVKCLPGSRFEEDCRLVRKDPEGLMKDVLQELPRKKGGYHSDICDAVLYGWRAARHYLYEPPKALPAPDPERDQVREGRVQQAQEQPRNRQWWEEARGARGPGHEKHRSPGAGRRPAGRVWRAPLGHRVLARGDRTARPVHHHRRQRPSVLLRRDAQRLRQPGLVHRARVPGVGARLNVRLVSAVRDRHQRQLPRRAQR